MCSTPLWRWIRQTGRSRMWKWKLLGALDSHEAKDELCIFVNTEQQQQSEVPLQGRAAVCSENDEPQLSHSTPEQFYYCQKGTASIEMQRSSSQKVFKIWLNCKQEGHFVTWCPDPLTEALFEWQRAFLVVPNVGNDYENLGLVSSGPGGRDQYYLPSFGVSYQQGKQRDPQLEKF